jgi:chromate transporter
VPSSIDWAAAILSILALVAVLRLKMGIASVLGGAALAGFLLYVTGHSG